MSADRCTRYRDEGADRAAAWQDHVRRCRDCARQARLDALLREGYAAMSRPRPSPELTDRLEAALDAEADSRATGVVRRAPAARPEAPAGRWLQRLYWLLASGTSVVLLGRAVAAGPGPAGWAVAGGAAVILGLAVLLAGRVLRTSPGLLILRSI